MSLPMNIFQSSGSLLTDYGSVFDKISPSRRNSEVRVYRRAPGTSDSDTPSARGTYSSGRKAKRSDPNEPTTLSSANQLIDTKRMLILRQANNEISDLIVNQANAPQARELALRMRDLHDVLVVLHLKKTGFVPVTKLAPHFRQFDKGLLINGQIADKRTSQERTSDAEVNAYKVIDGEKGAIAIPEEFRQGIEDLIKRPKI